jgi:hypothetical protein
LKLERATKHIVEFEQTSIEFLLSDPYLVRVKKNASAGETHERFLGRDAFWGSELWSDLCCAAGDAIHNMRSALDHVAYAVALQRRYPADLLKTIQFVITSSRKNFNDQVSRRKMHLIGRDWVTFLRCKQPYLKRNGNGLLRLSMLDNVDKHRELLSLAPIARVSTWRRGGDVETNIVSLKKGVVTGPLAQGTESRIVAPYITLANTVPYEQRHEAMRDLLNLREDVSSVVREAKTQFFSR